MLILFCYRKLKTTKCNIHHKQGNCDNIWQNENFAMPGLRVRTFKINSTATEKILRHLIENTYVDKHSQSFMKKIGAMYAEQFVISASLYTGLNQF